MLLASGNFNHKWLIKPDSKCDEKSLNAWDLREDLRAVFRAGGASEAEELLDAWLHAATYCRIRPVVELGH